MPHIDLRLASILVTALATFLPKHVTSQIPTKPTFFSVDCEKDNTGDYARNSTYHNNLNLLVSDLNNHASTAPFYNSSVGPTNGPNTAYGQYYCRGDISTQLCSDCVKAATKEISDGGKCFRVKGGNVWFQECTLHYENKSNVGFWDNSLGPDWSFSDVNVSDPTKFEQVFVALLDTLIKKAAYGGDPKQFATYDPPARRAAALNTETIEEGAVHIVVPGNFPIGCLPIYHTIFATNDTSMYDELKCLKNFNLLVKFQNRKIKEAIRELKQQNPGVIIAYADFYNAYRWLIRNAASLGLEEDQVFNGCCGSLAIQCGVTGAQLCENPKTRISWDGVHPTHQANKLMTQWLLPRIFNN